jgi:hypothetical protein
MEKEMTIPSRFQLREFVYLNLFDAGTIKDCMVDAITIKDGKVYYDVSVKIKEGYYTSLKRVDSAFVEKP